MLTASGLVSKASRKRSSARRRSASSARSASSVRARVAVRSATWRPSRSRRASASHQSLWTTAASIDMPMASVPRISASTTSGEGRARPSSERRYQVVETQKTVRPGRKSRRARWPARSASAEATVLRAMAASPATLTSTPPQVAEARAAGTVKSEIQAQASSAAARLGRRRRRPRNPGEEEAAGEGGEGRHRRLGQEERPGRELPERRERAGGDDQVAALEGEEAQGRQVLAAPGLERVAGVEEEERQERPQAGERELRDQAAPPVVPGVEQLQAEEAGAAGHGAHQAGPPLAGLQPERADVAAVLEGHLARLHRQRQAAAGAGQARRTGQPDVQLLHHREAEDQLHLLGQRRGVEGREAEPAGHRGEARGGGALERPEGFGRERRHLVGGEPTGGVLQPHDRLQAWGRLQARRHLRRRPTRQHSGRQAERDRGGHPGWRPTPRGAPNPPTLARGEAGLSVRSGVAQAAVFHAPRTSSQAGLCGAAPGAARGSARGVPRRVRPEG